RADGGSPAGMSRPRIVRRRTAAPEPSDGNGYEPGRQSVPCDRVLQVIVRQVDQGNAADRQAAGVGRGIGIDEERQHRRRSGKPGARRHRRQILPVEDILGEIVVGQDEGWLFGHRIAGKARQFDPALDLALGPRGRLLSVEWDEAAIHEQISAVVEFQRGVDVVARRALLGRKQVALAGMAEAARDNNRNVVDVAGVLEALLDLPEAHRLRMNPLVDPGEQLFLPLKPLHLPCAEADQHDESGRDQHQQDSARSPDEVHLTVGHRCSRRPSWARLRYWSVINTPLNSLSAASDSTSVSGIHSRKCTQSGGEKLTSAHSASPTTMKPMIRMTKTAGPSPESAKA